MASELEYFEIAKYLFDNGALQTNEYFSNNFKPIISNEDLSKEDRVNIIKSIIGEIPADSSILFSIKNKLEYDYFVEQLSIDIYAQVLPSNITILHKAALRMNPELVEYLLFKGFDVNVQDSIGTTPITYAAMAFGPRINWEEPVIENDEKARPHYVSDMPYYADGISWQKKNVLTFSLLLKAGANLNIQNEYGWSVLHFAAASKPAGLIDILLSNGADKNLQTIFERNAIKIAEINKNDSALESLR